MEISLFMLKDRIVAQGITIEHAVGNDVTVYAVRLQNSPLHSKGILNVIQSNTLEVTCICENSSFQIIGLSLIQAFNAVLDAWDFFEQCERALSHVSISDTSMQEILDIAMPVFDNPCFICCGEGHVYAYSKEFEKDDTLDLWESVATLHKVPHMYINSLHDPSSNQEFMTRKNAKIYSNKDYRYIGATLFYRGEILLHIHIIERQTKLSDSMCTFTDFVLTTIENFYHHYPNEIKLVSSIFCDLLDQKPVSYERLSWAFTSLNWNLQNSFVLLYFIPETNQLTIERFLRYMRQTISKGKSFLWSGKAILLIEEKALSLVREELECALAKMRYRCGVSLPIQNWQDLAFYFQQAEVAYLYADPDETTCFCNQHILDYLVAQISGKMEQMKLCHFAVLKLQEFDMQNNSRLLYTLYMYLVCERNSALTSERLFIHRNTLQYRLNKIKDICPIQLDDPTTRLHIITSYKQIQYMRKVGGNPPQYDRIAHE